MTRKEWDDPATRTIYDFGRECYRRGFDYKRRDVEVALKFGRDDATLDIAGEGYWDEKEDAEGVEIAE